MPQSGGLDVTDEKTSRTRVSTAEPCAAPLENRDLRPVLDLRLVKALLDEHGPVDAKTFASHITQSQPRAPSGG